MKTAVYKVYLKGVYVGTLVCTPAQVQKLETAGYNLRKQNPTKHRTQLKPKERRLFGRRLRTGRIIRASKSHPLAPKGTNPKGLVKIYDHITRIEGTKGANSLFPKQPFYHDFDKPYPAMYGTPDRKTLIIKMR